MKKHIREFRDVAKLNETMKSADLRKLLRSQMNDESVVASKLLGGEVTVRTEFIDGTRDFRAIWTRIS